MARTFGLVGASVLMLGVFTPIIRVPIVGSVNYFRNGQGDGVILLIVGAISLALVFAGRLKWLFTTGLVALTLLGITYWNLTSRLEEMRADLRTDLADNPFRGLAEVAAESVQLEWGWAILVAASFLLITASLLRAGQRNTKRCPYCAEAIQVEAVFCKHCRQALRAEPQIEGAPITVHAPEIAEPILPTRVVVVTGMLIIFSVVVFGLREYIAVAISIARS